MGVRDQGVGGSNHLAPIFWIQTGTGRFGSAPERAVDAFATLVRRSARVSTHITLIFLTNFSAR
jgi:hypothetical protein